MRHQSGWQDSNLRPPDPKSGTLAKLSHTPYYFDYLSITCDASNILYDVAAFVNNFFQIFWIFSNIHKTIHVKH